ncbi:MAG: hypothetical protein M3Q07_26010 [Pseudobdellovibrionaceae bacterium]|nr:hypothetical protein [Pseudobdellovibrionaceae bacterium]
MTERRATRNNILENRVEPYELESYALVGASVFMPFKLGSFDQSVNLRIDNLLDKEYADPGFGGVDIPGRRRSLILNYSATL